MPSSLRSASFKAYNHARKAPVAARCVMADVQKSGMVETASGLAKSVCAKYEPVAKDLYTKYEPMTEEYALHMYNQKVEVAAKSGYKVAAHLPIIPIDKIAEAIRTDNMTPVVIDGGRNVLLFKTRSREKTVPGPTQRRGSGVDSLISALELHTNTIVSSPCSSKGKISMANCLRMPMASSLCCSSSASAVRFSKRPSCSATNSSKIPMPPINPKDPFLSRLASLAATSPDTLLNKPKNSDTPPFLDVFDSPTLMATPAQVERSVSYNEHRPRRPPPDLPSLLLHGRIVYIGMPLVPAVTELIVAELMYLQWMDPKEPIYLYINSTGTTRDDGETVGMETEGFAIYDAMMQLKNEIIYLVVVVFWFYWPVFVNVSYKPMIHTVAVGAAIGHACLLLSAGSKGKRFMMPHAKAMIQQPRVPSSGLMPASDVLIRAKEASFFVIVNRDVLVKLLAKHTGNSEEAVANVMKRPFYMDSTRAKEFGVIDKILWRGQEKIMADAAPPEEWDKNAGIKVLDSM
ncbi:hypothetical protein SASPL_105914 [Salvia splendens]|uniref:ATP-dependent Clp protease proteolytic subunit n=1 Tax=Salvia splendens TaxID=180675 RepID=A0A8X8YMA3_SALSN|nr:hypothetical protein SASPL_105914 [Salvia splendens]